MNEDILLAIGIALVKALRKNIKYSENIDSLYKGYENNSFKLSRAKAVFETYNRNDESEKESIARFAIQYGVSYCDGFAASSVYIGEMLDLKNILNSEKVYFTAVNFPGHVFCILHQSETYHNAELISVNDFKALSELPGLSNAIIIDPWLYISEKLSNYQTFIAHVKSYHASDFYQGDIQNYCQYSKLNYSNAKQPQTPKERKIVDDFYEAFEEEIKKLNNMDKSFSAGKALSDVRQDLAGDIIKWNETLTDLKRFIQRLASNASLWYSGFGHSDRKGRAYKNLIEYIDHVQAKGDRVCNEDILKIIFQAALEIAPIIRGKKGRSNIAHEFIDMTSTALGLLDETVVPNEPYKFENNEGMSLDHFRDIRENNKIDNREKYTELLLHIFGGKFDDSLLYKDNEKINAYAKAESPDELFHRISEDLLLAKEPQIK